MRAARLEAPGTRAGTLAGACGCADAACVRRPHACHSRPTPAPRCGRRPRGRARRRAALTPPVKCAHGVAGAGRFRVPQGGKRLGIAGWGCWHVWRCGGPDLGAAGWKSLQPEKPV
eukprot:359501-Chlamydomonas_euryale.AAC.4